MTEGPGSGWRAGGPGLQHWCLRNAGGASLSCHLSGWDQHRCAVTFWWVECRDLTATQSCYTKPCLFQKQVVKVKSSYFARKRKNPREVFEPCVFFMTETGGRLALIPENMQATKIPRNTVESRNKEFRLNFWWICCFVFVFVLPFLLARPYVPRCVPPSAWRFPRRGTWKHSNLWRDWPQWRQMQRKRPGFFQLNTAMSGCLRDWLFDAAIHTDSKPQIHLGLEGGFPSRRFQCTWRRHQGSIAPGNSGVLCQLQLLDMNEFGTAGIPIKGKPLERSAQDVYFTSLGIVFKIYTFLWLRHVCLSICHDECLKGAHTSWTCRLSRLQHEHWRGGVQVSWQID